MIPDPTMEHMTFDNADGDSNISVLVNGKLYGCRSDHRNWDEIVAKAKAKDPSVVDLFKPADTITAKFAELTDRISVNNGTILWDGDPVHDSLTERILALMDERVEDWRVFVNFMENLYTNPNEHSKKMAFDYLMRHKFTITPEGNFLAYKGVEVRDGRYYSTQRGDAIVDDVQLTNSKIPYDPGSVVRMPRSVVKHDPNTSCHVGLHVATWDFAESFSQKVLQVEVNPRDIVNVPTFGQNKMRVCRLKVIGEVTAPTTAVYQTPKLFEAVIETPSVVVTPDDQPDATEGQTVLDPSATPDANIAEPTKATDKPKRRRYPSPAEWDEMRARAKRRKQNFAKFATKQGPWNLFGDDPTNRKHWEK